MHQSTYANLAKAWEYVENHALARQTPGLRQARMAAEEASMPQGSAAQARLLALLVRMMQAKSVIVIGTGQRLRQGRPTHCG